MYKLPINKILQSISKEHTALLLVTEMPPFVSCSAVLFFSLTSVTLSQGSRILHRVVVAISQRGTKKRWHVTDD